jgi:5-methylcytosine-specific restriction endonuclease McrA
MTRKVKDDILKLRAEGKSYRQIQKILGCWHSSITYHCGEGQKEKALLRSYKHIAKHPYITKLHQFLYDKRFLKKQRARNLPHSNDKITKILYIKLKFFYNGEKIMLSINDIINKLGENPKCYLTGRPIDISKSRSYHFDHILPRTRGGQNTLDNLGIACKEANMAKTDATVEEFIQLCKEVLINFGYEIKKSDNLKSN